MSYFFYRQSEWRRKVQQHDRDMAKAASKPATPKKRERGTLRTKSKRGKSDV